MAFKTLDPLQTTITVGGTPISGFIDGTFVSVEYDEDQWTKVTGVDGFVTRVKTNNYSGRVTLSLQETSPSNTFLFSLWNDDRANNEGVVSIQVKSESTGETFTANNAWPMRYPASAHSKGIEGREWIFDCGEIALARGE